MAATEKFQGFYYCSYLNVNNHRRTRYFRNNALVNLHLDGLLENIFNSGSSDEELAVNE